MYNKKGERKELKKNKQMKTEGNKQEKEEIGE
jgi:hypothetical protein